MYIFSHLYLVYYIMCYTVLSGFISIQAPPQKLNVIIFFTEYDQIPNCIDGISYLQMREMARVKHGDELNYLKKYVFRRNLQNCQELLEQSLESLIHFSQNALGMKTAVVKSEYHHNSITAPSNNQFESPHQFIQSPASNQAKFKKSNHQSEINTNTNKNNIVLNPEHTEVFQIRVKRNPGEDEDELSKVPVNKKKTKSDWDILDIMSHVRFSFFGNLFDREKKMLAEEGNDVLTNLNGNYPDDSSLFEAVRSTLNSLQETPCDGFLMVVFGGRLNEIGDVRSPLIQSLKHVTEVTDPQNTLIVVTASCPEMRKADCDVVEIKEGVAKKVQNLTVLPVYAKGPNSERLTQCTVLYDIPLTVKNILEEISPKFKRT